MRLWSLHPRYLDPQGLVALWREGLLAQAVLLGKTRGYRNHPQLWRFQAAAAPEHSIGTYLTYVLEEAGRRGYEFDGSKIVHPGRRRRLKVTASQVDYERRHLHAKLSSRSPEWLASVRLGRVAAVHPMFTVHDGEVESWERNSR